MSITRTLHPSPPTQEELRAAAHRIGLEEFDIDLAVDICNLLDGGTLLYPTGYLEDVQREIELETASEAPEGGWGCSYLGWQITFDRREAVEDGVYMSMLYQEHVYEFLLGLDADGLPGDTPLEKAVGCMKLLSFLPGGEGSELLPLFWGETGFTDLAAALVDVAREVEKLNEEGKRALLESSEYPRYALELALRLTKSFRK